MVGCLLPGIAIKDHTYGAVKWSKYHFNDVVHEINGIELHTPTTNFANSMHNIDNLTMS
jgi:hypothetical protein